MAGTCAPVAQNQQEHTKKIFTLWYEKVKNNGGTQTHDCMNWLKLRHFLKKFVKKH